MKRRSFLKTTGAIALGAHAATNNLFGFVPAHNWEKYDFVDVVFKHNNMDHEIFFTEIRKNWDALYNDKVLKKKFLRTLKQTRSPLAAIWSYGSNLQYYNMVYEGLRPPKKLEDIFGEDESKKEILKSSPFK